MKIMARNKMKKTNNQDKKINLVFSIQKQPNFYGEEKDKILNKMNIWSNIKVEVIFMYNG